MRVYVAKISEPSAVQSTLELSEFTHDRIYNFEQDIVVGDPVFIYLGGDRTQVGWTSGLRAVGKITREPFDKGYDPSHPRYFKVGIQPFHALSRSLLPRESKIHPRYGSDLYDMPYVGANHFPNQAIASSNNAQAIEALVDMYLETAASEGTGLSARMQMKRLGLLSHPSLGRLRVVLFDSLITAGISSVEDTAQRSLVALQARPFLLLSGLSGSGKTLVARFFGNFMNAQPMTFVSYVTRVIEASPDLSHYSLVSANNALVEVVNSRGSSGKVIPLCTSALREWYEALLKGVISRTDDPRKARDAIKESSRFQAYVHGFYNDYLAVGSALLDLDARAQADTEHCFELVAVGANWTSKDDLLGYPDALRPGRFVKRPALELLLRAHENWKETAGNEGVRPYFLILDEMNLSHVERYFSDFLSAMESDEEVELHDISDPEQKPDEGQNLWDGVPARIRIPGNLFVIGTVNVDETTYMFSPKVMDRANVIEFRTQKAAVTSFLGGEQDVKLDAIAGRGSRFAEAFVQAANSPTQVAAPYTDRLKDEVGLIFEFLADHEGEFGFRTARAISRFVQFYDQLQGELPKEAQEEEREKRFREAMDAQIMQKILPKMHGSKRKLGPVLRGLGELCYDPGKETDARFGAARAAASNHPQEDSPFKTKLDELSKTACQAVEGRKGRDYIRYPMSFEKIVRMLRKLDRDGFTSFAEA